MSPSLARRVVTWLARFTGIAPAEGDTPVIDAMAPEDVVAIVKFGASAPFLHNLPSEWQTMVASAVRAEATRNVAKLVLAIRRTNGPAPHPEQHRQP